MTFIKTKLGGVYTIKPNVFNDARGQFIKTYHKDTFQESQIDLDIREMYYSISHKNVIRGMHFQTPPEDHAKLIYVTRGRIIDVILDIRSGSPTYGQYISLELSYKNHMMVYITAGFAHGFLALEDHSYVLYSQTTVRSAEHEGGIHVGSFGMDWEATNLIMSERDKGFPQFNDFKTPFIYKNNI